MKANDLMIGDWVYNKYIDKPMQIYPMIFSQMFRSNPNATTEDYNIYPIPITKEVLKKNGFSHNEIWHNSFVDIENYYIDIQFGYGGKVDNIKIRKNGNGSVIPSEQNNIYLAHMEYVHQLQHAMCICGIEKEIVI